MEHPQEVSSDHERYRRTGRTTRLLVRAADWLYEGKDRSVLFVVHHNALIQYCVNTLHHQLGGRMLFYYSRRQAVFQNREGDNVHIQFCVMDEEPRHVRGYRRPTFRDHDVVRRRRSPESRRGVVYDELLAAGYSPTSEFDNPFQKEQ